MRGPDVNTNERSQKSEPCLIAPLSSSLSFSPYSLASELMLKILVTYTIHVQIQQLIQETALTSPISKPFCLLSLPLTPPTPPDSRTPRWDTTSTGSRDFSFAGEMSLQKFAFAASPSPSTKPYLGVRMRVRLCSITTSACSDTLTGPFYRQLTAICNEGGLIRLNGNVSSNQEDRFEDLVSTMMNQAADKAANSSRKFYTIKANWTALETLYGLVQCTPDLSRYDCLRCLHQSIEMLGTLIWPSCNARYELYLFFNETGTGTPSEQQASPPPQRLLPPPPASTSPVSSLPRPGKHWNFKMVIVAIVVAIVVAVLLSIAGYCFLDKRTKKTSDNAPAFYGDDITTIESLQLDYRIIQAATNNYSENNKIGQGGFGEVYKGTFPNGVEVAVKRLSKSSKQGDTEFNNEVAVAAKLQHRNLVRLLGFSLEQKKRILVYEYVPNKSLDYFLFGQLDWTHRYTIIGGISRGILYLHQDSRLTIIHRDLKASNILLEADINPKVANFGMAKIFGMDQTHDNTSEIVGT
ncbi:hypothetical protein YC2023_031828 [Brassica napus]